jgi:hypothetical protein
MYWGHMQAKHPPLQQKKQTEQTGAIHSFFLSGSKVADSVGKEK